LIHAVWDLFATVHDLHGVQEFAHLFFAILSPRQARHESPFDETFPGEQVLHFVPRAFGSLPAVQVSLVLTVVLVVFVTEVAAQT
jgi:hypothetical protein